VGGEPSEPGMTGGLRKEASVGNARVSYDRGGAGKRGSGRNYWQHPRIRHNAA